MAELNDTRSWTDPQGLTHTASCIYKDAAGNAWWAFDRPLQMPAPRAVAAELASEWALMNFTAPDLLAYIEKMEQDGNTGQIVEMFKTLGYMKERIAWHCEGRALLELAKVYFAINDEPLSTNTELHDEQKEQVWKEDPEARAFFLHKAFVITKGYSGFSESDIPAYLKAQETLHMTSPVTQSVKPKRQEQPEGSEPRGRFSRRKLRT
jgi:hypothetical protein